MTVDVTYVVTCDGPHPNSIDFPNEMCEAEFTVEVFGRFSDIARVRRQLDGRGWAYRSRKFYCPLHNHRALVAAGPVPMGDDQ